MTCRLKYYSKEYRVTYSLYSKAIKYMKDLSITEF